MNAVLEVPTRLDSWQGTLIPESTGYRQAVTLSPTRRAFAEAPSWELPAAYQRPWGSGAVRVLPWADARALPMDPWLRAILSAVVDQFLTVLSFDVPAVLGRIRHELSLNTAELARVLNVSRPTVYAWADGGPAKPENRMRLALLRDVADTWRTRCQRPIGALVREPASDSRTLVDLLAAQQLDMAQIVSRFDHFAALIDQRIAQRRALGPSMRELAAKHGFNPIPKETLRQTLEWQASRGK